MKQFSNSLKQNYLKSIKQANPINQLQQSDNLNHSISQNTTFPPVSEIQQRQPSIKSQFQRYEQKQQKRIRQVNQNRKQKQSIQSLPQVGLQASKKQQQSSQTYKDWKVYKNKSQLNLLPFPYCCQQSFQTKRFNNSPLSLFNFIKTNQKQVKEEKQKPQFLPKLYKLKIQNKVQINNETLKENKVYRPYFNYQKTPINQYLSYDLTQEINMGLREVQIMAEEIRRIKKAKKVASDDLAEKEKQAKPLKIRKSYVKNYKGLFQNKT